MGCQDDHALYSGVPEPDPGVRSTNTKHDGVSYELPDQCQCLQWDPSKEASKIRPDSACQM